MPVCRLPGSQPTPCTVPGAVEIALRHAGKGYVLGVSATSQFNSWGAKPPVAGTAAGIAAALDPSAWHRLSAGSGSKGERLFDWAYLELADLEATEYNEPQLWISRDFLCCQ